MGDPKDLSNEVQCSFEKITASSQDNVTDKFFQRQKDFIVKSQPTSIAITLTVRSSICSDGNIHITSMRICIRAQYKNKKSDATFLEIFNESRNDVTAKFDTPEQALNLLSFTSKNQIPGNWSLNMGGSLPLHMLIVAFFEGSLRRKFFIEKFNSCFCSIQNLLKVSICNGPKLKAIVFTDLSATADEDESKCSLRLRNFPACQALGILPGRLYQLIIHKAPILTYIFHLGNGGFSGLTKLTLVKCLYLTTKSLDIALRAMIHLKKLHIEGMHSILSITIYFPMNCAKIINCENLTSMTFLENCTHIAINRCPSLQNVAICLEKSLCYYSSSMHHQIPSNISSANIEMREVGIFFPT
jgi:hypothetical protein